MYKKRNIGGIKTEHRRKIGIGVVSTFNVQTEQYQVVTTSISCCVYIIYIQVLGKNIKKVNV